MATTTEDPGRIASALPAQIKQPRKGRRRPSAAADAEQELGATGTQNMLGIISGVEYLPALVPPDGLKVYEQMRNFAQVHASLYIVKAPILSSTPVVRPPKNGDPIDQGIADFVQQALFGPGAMRVSWRRVFEHLLTRLDFGVSLSEKVWRYDVESGMWRVAKVAPRLATTIWEWRQDPKTNELGTVLQQAIKADGSWNQIPIPAQKCLISTHQREGDNYWGRSILRSAYFHWYAIMELLRIGLVRADRWGVGIPKAKFTSTQAWGNAKLVAQVKRALKALRSHERAYLLESPDVDFKMMDLAGNDGGIKLKDDIDFHASMIIQNVLATFLTSQADGMATNRTSKLADVFSSVLELVAGDVAEDLDQQVVRELCDLNFVMTGREYPTVQFTNIADTDLEALADQVGRLYAIGALTPTREDEQFFREQYKLPANTELDAEEGDPDARRRAPRGAPPTGPTGRPADPNSEDDGGEEDDDPTLRLRMRDDLVLLARAPTDLETFLLREPEQIARSLNYMAGQLERRLAEIRRLQLTALAKQIAKRDARTTTKAFTDLRPDYFAIPEKGLAEKALRATHKSAFAYGRRRVRQELARQGAAVELRLTSDAEEWSVRLAGSRAAQPQPDQPQTSADATSALTTSAKVTAERLNDAWFNRILEVATRLRRGGSRGEQLVREVYDALETEIGSGLYGTAKAEVNEALGLGRAVEAKVNGDEIETCVWSCLLDVNSCQPCIDRDGIETPYGSEEYVKNPVPYKFCEGNKGGGDACRCEWLFLMKSRTV